MDRSSWYARSRRPFSPRGTADDRRGVPGACRRGGGSRSRSGQLDPALYARPRIELVERGDRWHFQTAPDLAHLLRRDPRRRRAARAVARAATRDLAIVAYHKPVSRAEIEAIRGVQISKGTLDVLMDAGWVRPAGRRKKAGRPLIYATTLDSSRISGLSAVGLPGIDDLKAAELRDPLDQSPVFQLQAGKRRPRRLGRPPKEFPRWMVSDARHILILAIILLVSLAGNRTSSMMGDVAKGLKN